MTLRRSLPTFTLLTGLAVGLVAAAPTSTGAPAAVEARVGSDRPTGLPPMRTTAPADIATSFAVTSGTGVTLHHSFVSATGWVKPGDTFPIRTFVANDGDAPAQDVSVTITPPPSLTFVRVQPLQDAGTATIGPDGAITWTLGTVADNGVVETLVTEARAATLEQDSRLVWKDLSSTATLSQSGAEPVSSVSHGPKVIPPTGGFETARYGDKPYAVVTAEYTDRKHRETSDTAELDRILNGVDFEGSSFNLFQEMSYGQLFPEGRVPSSGIESASWEGAQTDRFTIPAPGGACRGTTLGLTPQALDSGLAGDRIVDGWYQLPGDTEYYGGDDPVFPYGLLVGLPQPHSKDTACGASSKAVFDAALIADPEIDYNEFDSDRDGIVDFFMLIFVGCGGNGESQLGSAFGCPDPVPYDNIWPHSSSLEFNHVDPDTGLRGFLSTDQLRSIEEVPQCWLNENYRDFDDCAANGGSGDDALPVPVRVGPYNVNPEGVFESASVISHEYGHHLGLPDFYNSSFSAGGTFELMAADYSQHMTVFSKQDLGWVVPRYLAPGETRTVQGWDEIKDDTGEIQWWTPSGEPYTLSAASGDQNIHNGEAYAVKLPGRLTIGEEVFETGGSASHAWHSGRGNDFGCPPTQGHNLDIDLPELADVPAGSTVTLRLQSAWDIEWDWDYGFVLGTTDGETYQSFPSQNNYTTLSSYNPNNAGCLTELDNGLTGSSAAYAGGEPAAASSRIPANEVYGLPLTFVEDSFDISALAGSASSIRFGYFTDPAFERPGWFIDDVEVLVDGEVVYSSDFEADRERTRLYPGGCDADGNHTSVFCTVGWTRVAAGQANPADHAYYLELRDRSGFDVDGHGQSDRGAIKFEPGVFVQYTDEDWGYGNNSLSDHPAQHYLDSSPNVGDDCDDAADATCHDAAFTDESGRDRFSDAADAPWEDNFEATGGDAPWTFAYDCLDLEVVRMSGEDTTTDPADLRADAVITAGDGCVTPAFMTGAQVSDQGAQASAPPVAVAQAKPTSAGVREEVLLDGSGSSDDVDSPDELRYAWDFGDGTNATGQTARHAWAEAGTYEVVLTVTDSDGQTATASVTVEVAVGATPLPATGGGLALLGLVAVGLAGGVASRFRRS